MKPAILNGADGFLATCKCGWHAGVRATYQASYADWLRHCKDHLALTRGQRFALQHARNTIKWAMPATANGL